MNKYKIDMPPMSSMGMNMSHMEVIEGTSFYVDRYGHLHIYKNLDTEAVFKNWTFIKKVSE